MAKSKSIREITLVDKKELAKDVTLRFMIISGEIMMAQRRAGGQFKTRSAFAASLKMPNSIFNYYENQEGNVSLENLCELVRVWGVNAHWLFTGEGERYQGQGIANRVFNLEARITKIEEQLIKKKIIDPIAP